jgi:hypothetical protein
MKNQYVGDVNDYLKYALLRALIHQDFQLYVVWMLTESDDRTDGQRVAYLGRPHEFRRLDPPLFDALAQIVNAERRSVEAVEAAAILPNAVYLADVLRDGIKHRTQYFDRVDQLAGRSSAVVFLDPDNGFEVNSVRLGARNSAKYLFWSEARAAYSHGNSLVVYQHFPRRPRSPFLNELAATARSLTGSISVFALQTGHVAFVVIPQPDHQQRLVSRLSAFSAHAAPYATAVFGDHS